MARFLLHEHAAVAFAHELEQTGQMTDEPTSELWRAIKRQQEEMDALFRKLGAEIAQTERAAEVSGEFGRAYQEAYERMQKDASAYFAQVRRTLRVRERGPIYLMLQQALLDAFNNEQPPDDEQGEK